MRHQVCYAVTDASKPIVLVGAGGIGAPVAWTLAAAGLSALTVIDEDRVETSNLHRQVLFDANDVGRSKVEVFREKLAALGVEVNAIAGRALPATVEALVAEAGLIIDATDNFASRFLLADAAYLGGVAIVHAAAVRWQATVMSVAAGGRPCYRCFFEDIPGGPAPDCASAGVVGPVCGVSGALAAEGALQLLQGQAAGELFHYDGLRDRLRKIRVAARPDCPLCSDQATIGRIELSRYTSAPCDSELQS